GNSDVLKLDGTSAEHSLSFSSASGTLELGSSGTLTVGTALSIGTGTVQLDGASSALTDNSGISLSTGMITGLGSVTGAITASDEAGRAACGGRVEVQSVVSCSEGTLARTISGKEGVP